MKCLHVIIMLMLSCFVIACSQPEKAPASVDSAITYDAFEDASKNPDANISHEGDWTIVSRVENGDRVYWFVAPDKDKVSPALFKKTVHDGDKEKETVTVSNCEAPRQTCDSLMEKFKTLSEKYK